MYYESKVIEIVEDYLSKLGFSTKSKVLGNRPGIDLVCERDTDKKEIWIEAKGGTSERSGSNRFGQPFNDSQCHDHFSRAFFKAVSDREKNLVENQGRALIAIAISHSDFYQKYFDRVETTIKDLGIIFFWVKDGERVEVDGAKDELFSMKLNKVSVPQSELLYLNKDTQTAFIVICYAMNEINFLQKMILMNQDSPNEAHPIFKSGKLFIIKFTISAQIGRLKELWEFLKNRINTNEEFREIIGDLGEEILGFRKELNRYFGKKNIIDLFRNEFTSHYNFDQVRLLTENLSDKIQHEIIFSQDSSNDFFPTSDQLYHVAMIGETEGEKFSQQLGGILKEIQDVTFNMLAFCRGIIMGILKKTKFTHEEVSIGLIPKVTDLDLFYFFEIQKELIVRPNEDK